MTTTETRKTATEEPHERTDGPVHLWFGLSYCNFLVWHRALMQSMPLEWQQRFTELAEELDAAYPDGTGVDYEVNTVHLKYMSDLTLTEMHRLDVSESEDGGEYYLTDGTAVPPVHRVGIPVRDPVPHYNRGRTYLPPDEDAIAALRASRAVAPKD